MKFILFFFKLPLSSLFSVNEQFISTQRQIEMSQRIKCETVKRWLDESNATIKRKITDTWYKLIFYISIQGQYNKNILFEGIISARK